MIRENIYQPFEIVIKELDECPKSEHSHSFFELVYILSGTGLQCINKNNFAYHPGHLFLITPEDCHSFNISTTTHFLFIRFNDIYVRSAHKQGDAISRNNLINRLEFILHNANHEPGCILRNQGDKALAKPLVESLIREYVNRDLYNKELIEQLVNTLIILVARNIAKAFPQEVDEQTDNKAVNILEYIQKHICSPEKLRTDVISSYFNISGNYLGKYFKKQTNETMQQYITNYKLKMVENRLLHSQMRIGEIVTELGFTDESHLNRIFKKHKGVNPSVFRKTKAVTPL